MASTSKSYVLDIQVRGSRETQAMVAELARLSSAQAKLTNASARMAAEERKVAAAVNGTTTALQKANAAAAGTGKGFKLMGKSIEGWQVNQLATQFGDLIVQLEGGAGAARAFGQQASQLGSIFTGWVGLAITAGSAVALLAPALIEATKTSRTFEDAQEGVADALDRLNAPLDVLKSSLDELREKYGSAADEVVRLARLEAQLASQNLAAELGKQVTELREAAAGFGQFESGLALSGRNLRALSLRLGLTSDEARKLSAAFVQMVNSDLKDIPGLTRNFETWEKTLAEVGLTLDDLPESVRGAVTEALALARQSAEAGAAMELWEKFARNAAEAAGQTVEQVAAVAETAKRAAEELKRLRDATDNLSLDTAALEAQNRSLAQGNDLIRARADALIAQKRLELETALNSDDRDTWQTAREDLAEYTREVNRNVEAQRRYNSLTETTTKTTTNIKKGYDDGRLSVEQFTAILERYRTEGEQAAIMQAKLNDAIARYGLGDVVNGTELFARAMRDLAESGQTVSKEMQAVSDIVAGSMTDAFDSIIDGSKSASEAFGDMLNSMLRDIAKFLMSQLVQKFISAAVGVTTPTATVPTASPSTFSAPNVQAFTLPQPTVTAAPAMFSAPMAMSASTRSSEPENLIGRGANSGGLNVVINNTASDAVGVSVAEGQDVNGQRMLEIWVEKEVKKQIGSGSLDKALRTNYGIRRNA